MSYNGQPAAVTVVLIHVLYMYNMRCGLLPTHELPVSSAQHVHIPNTCALLIGMGTEHALTN